MTREEIIMAAVTISGDVKVSESRKVLTIWEQYTAEYIVQGVPKVREAKRKWTVWFAVPGDINDGDWVEVKGELGTKIGSYEKDGETKQAVEHSINAPVILQHKVKDKPLARDADDEAKYAPF